MKKTAQKWRNSLAIRRVYHLEDPLKRIILCSVHDEIDFGGPVGREALQ